jgi:hypothetical protein
MTDEQWDLVGFLVPHSRWQWETGMRMRSPDEHDHGYYMGGDLPENVWPDLDDFATGGALLGQLDALGILVDVAKEGQEWIVAIEMADGLRGWVGNTLAEAAGWALLQTWGPEGDEEE